jgi:predicted TIM-barrel fold metal-dependent hydrolase
MIRSAALSIIGLVLAAGTARAQPAYLIDTHVHLEHQTTLSDGAAAAIDSMDHLRMRSIVWMPPPQPQGIRDIYEADKLRAAVDKYPGRIFIAGGGGSLNGILQATAPDAVTDAVAQKFRAQAEQLAGLGIVAYGEIALHHLSMRPMGPQHPYEVTAADHPLMLILADIAAAKGLPIDIHIDLVPQDMPLPDRPVFNASNPATLTANLPGFERLLAHNERAKIMWAHAGSDVLGTRTPALERELLRRHPNLYMSLRLSRGAPLPSIAFDETLQLKPVWLDLLREFPDRFVLGSDFFYGGGGRRGPQEESLENLWRLLCQLPAELADRIAHGNAEKIYNLPVAASAAVTASDFKPCVETAQTPAARPGMRPGGPGGQMPMGGPGRRGF